MRKSNPLKRAIYMIVSFGVMFACLYGFGIMLSGCSKPYIKAGFTQDAIGPKDVESGGFVEVGAFNPLIDVSKNSKIEWGHGLEGFVFDDQEHAGENDSAIAYNMTLKYGYQVTDNIEVYLGGGGLLDLTNDYRLNASLGDSRVFGIIYGGVKYDWLMIEIKHESSPFHGGGDGDVGINFITLGVDFELFER